MDGASVGVWKLRQERKSAGLESTPRPSLGDLRKEPNRRRGILPREAARGRVYIKALVAGGVLWVAEDAFRAAPPSFAMVAWPSGVTNPPSRKQPFACANFSLVPGGASQACRWRNRSGRSLCSSPRPYNLLISCVSVGPAGVTPNAAISVGPHNPLKGGAIYGRKPRPRTGARLPTEIALDTAFCGFERGQRVKPSILGGADPALGVAELDLKPGECGGRAAIESSIRQRLQEPLLVGGQAAD